MQQSGPGKIGDDRRQIAHQEGAVDAESPAVSNSGEAQTDPIKPIRRLPHPRVERFSGRDDLLQEVRSALESDGCVVLNDPASDSGGCGKSAAAIEYAYRRIDAYRVIWWLNASRLAILAGDYAALAKELSLPTDDDGQPAAVRAAHHWLSTHTGWLLIFDDVGPSCDLQPFFPHSSKGHIIVTSRHGPSNDTCKTISVGPLSRQESVAILAAAPGDEDTQVATDLAAALAEAPTALDMMAAYADASGLALSEALGSFEQSPIVKKEGEDSPAPLDSKTAVRTVLTAALKAVTEKNPVAQDLFAVCTFLGSDPLPLDSFRTDVGAFPAKLAEVVQNDVQLNAALDLLCQYGLMRRCETGVSLDRRVKRAARDGMTRDLKKGCAGAALRLVASGFNPEEDKPESLVICAKLLDHAYAVSMHTHQLNTATKRNDALLYKMGLYLMACEDPASAMQCFALAVELAKAIHGPRSPIAALRLNNLAIAQRDFGNLEDARANFEEAMIITETIVKGLRETKLDPSCESILVAPSRHLCPMLVEMGETDEALKVYAGAMGILAEAYDRNHPLVGDCASRVANIWFNRGNWKRAQKYFAQAVQAEENSLEGTDTRLSSHLINLGSTYLKLDQFEKARKQFDRALDIDLAEYGPDHRTVGRDLDKLGQALSAQKKYREAEEAYRRALSLHEKVDPQVPEDLSRCLKHLGRALEAQGDMIQAAPYFERLIAFDEVIYGAESVQVGKSLIALGRVLEEMDEHTRAQECYERALGIETAANGGETERAATSIHRIGRTLEAGDDLDGALSMYERAMDIDMKLNGKQHASVARDAYAIGCLLAAKKDNIVAMGHLTMALEVYEQTLGKSHSKTRKIRDKIAELGT